MSPPTTSPTSTRSATSRSRVTFQDSLTQMQRGAAGPTATNGGSNAAQVGLGVGLGSIDNLMTGGAVQTTGNPLDVAIQGDGFFQIGDGRPDRRRRPDHRHRLHPRGQLLDQLAGLPDHADRPVRARLRPAAGAPRPPDVAIKVPAGATGVAIDQSGGVSYIDPATRHRASRRTASRWRRSRTPPASSARAATSGSPRPTRASKT